MTLNKIVDIMHALKDEKSLDLFLNPTMNGRGRRGDITRKQYYDRMAKFRKLGLVTGRNSHTTHTLKGKIIIDVIQLLEKVQEYEEPLKAYDLLKTNGMEEIANQVLQNFKGLERLVVGKKQ